MVDGILARADLVAWRRPYMSDRFMRERINQGKIFFKDDHLSQLSAKVRAGEWGRCDVAVVEAAAITEKGHLIPTMSVGNTPTYVREAKKIIIEISGISPLMEGIHDIFIPEDPPYRMPIPLYRTADRIGKPYIEMDSDRVVAILFSTEQDHCPIFMPPNSISSRIAEFILDFVRHEMKKDRMPPSLPWQAGVGDVANAVLDGTDAVMLSEESAVGHNPILVIETMVNTIQSIEEIYPFDKFLEFKHHDPMDTVNESAVRLGDSLHAAGIIAMTTSGQSAIKLSRYRPEMTIYAATHDESVARVLTIVWGVVPAYLTKKGKLEDMLRDIITRGLARNIIDKTQTYIFTAGDPVGVKGTTNIIRILREHEIEFFGETKTPVTKTKKTVEIAPTLF